MHDRTVAAEAVDLHDFPAASATEEPQPAAPGRFVSADQAMKPLLLGLEVSIEFGLAGLMVRIHTCHGPALADEADALASVVAVTTPRRTDLLLDPFGIRSHGRHGRTMRRLIGCRDVLVHRNRMHGRRHDRAISGMCVRFGDRPLLFEDLHLVAWAPSPHDGTMSESSDPIPEMVASGREILLGDVVTLWSDLLSERRTAKETAARAQVLLDTVNASHVANLGLSSLYHLTYRGAPAPEDILAAHERWQQHLREYQADPEAWDRRYYQRMIVAFAKSHGIERARAFGGRLVATGMLRDADLIASLAGDPRRE